MGEHQFRENGSHYNGGAEFFGYGYDAIGEPRLHMVRKWCRQGARRGQTEDSFSVDGGQPSTYAEALEALKVPPVLAEEERPVLEAFVAGPSSAPEGTRYMAYLLRMKGFVTVRDRVYTITEAGRAALSANPLPQGQGEPRAEPPR